MSSIIDPPRKIRRKRFELVFPRRGGLCRICGFWIVKALHFSPYKVKVKVALYVYLFVLFVKGINLFGRCARPGTITHLFDSNIKTSFNKEVNIIQEEKKTEQDELVRFMDWVIKDQNGWESVAGFSETGPEELAATLKLLRDHQLHSMFLTVIKRNSHTMPLNRILYGVLWETVAKTVCCETIPEMEGRIIRELERALSERP